MDSPEAHPPISALDTGHSADVLPMQQEEAPSQPLHQEAIQTPDISQVDELEQRRLIEETLRAEAAQAMTAENPSPREIAMEAPVVPPPEPESILTVPPPRRSFMAGVLTQMKDGVIHLFEGLRKLLFSKKAEKPPRSTSFKNISRSESSVAFKRQDSSVAFKQQPAGA